MTQDQVGELSALFAALFIFLVFLWWVRLRPRPWLCWGCSELQGARDPWWRGDDGKRYCHQCIQED